ncbi:hypothetical protein DFH08DRAFT_886803 [Mycena albidolilacea]|uniref:Uncharacterized protein n=1 Tax=Mycena albidolilacea TaxID=1033008 RepID=A0AAD6ZIY7_9AGAR|nr:hypothetical protein DFH08DRAFT_886803 [Mycena albidolilacea]
MTQDLKDAGSKGKLSQFFSSTDEGSPLERHNTALVKLIAGSTGVKVDEVLGSLRKIESSKLQEFSSRKPTIVLGDLKGESDSPGGIGGEGGEGDGPRLEIYSDEFCRIGKISGEQPSSSVLIPVQIHVAHNSQAGQAASAGMESKSAGRAGRGRVR